MLQKLCFAGDGELNRGLKPVQIELFVALGALAFAGADVQTKRFGHLFIQALAGDQLRLIAVARDKRIQ